MGWTLYPRWSVYNPFFLSCPNSNMQTNRSLIINFCSVRWIDCLEVAGRNGTCTWPAGRNPVERNVGGVSGGENQISPFFFFFVLGLVVCLYPTTRQKKNDF